jgi:hypothetical protein
LSVNEHNFADENLFELSNENITQMIEFSNLIPGLCHAMSPQIGPNDLLIDLQNYPQHLLGIVPNPDFFACPQGAQAQGPSPVESSPYARLLHSPKSHPSTPFRK